MKYGNTYLPVEIFIPQIDFGSKLTDLIISLEKLRHRKLEGTTPFVVYDEIKAVFQILESLGSARIEGNRTTVAEFVEKVIEDSDKNKDETWLEIANINNAISFINQQMVVGAPITKALIFEVHKMLVSDLTREGSQYPGELRKVPVSIKGSSVVNPDFTQVPDYFDQLMEFVNSDGDSKYDLVRTAIAHHRFAYIHPFDNGNGRTVRLLTYMMLLKYGFNVKEGSIINPTAIFCTDRNKYYEMLSVADNHGDAGVIEWCVYVLEGLITEMQKIDRISDVRYVRKSLLVPVLRDALDKKYITDVEYKVLGYVVSTKDMIFKSADLDKIDLGLDERQRKFLIKKMKESRIIKPVDGENSRTYTISLVKNYLLRSLTGVLTVEGFIPQALND